MRFLVDANLPLTAVPLLQRFGHQAEHVRSLGLADAADAVIAARAKAAGAILLTRDLDFADMRRYPPAEHAGLLVLRVREDVVAAEILRVLENFLRQTELPVQLGGRLAILEPDRVRFRPPLR